MSYLSCPYGARVFGVRNLSLRFLSVLICIRIADSSWGMNNKRIIEFGFRRISELSRLRLNNSEYPAQPHLIIFNYSP